MPLTDQERRQKEQRLAELKRQKLAMLRAQKESRDGVDFSFQTMSENIIPSAKRAAGDLANVVMHPIDTAKAVGNLALGGVDKGIDYLVPGDIDFGKEKYADAFGQMVKDRYGSWDNVKKTAMYDPVGMGMDVAGLLGPAAALPGKAAQIGKVGAAVNPATATARAGQQLAARPLLGAIAPELPQNMMANTMKYSTTIPKATRDQMIATQLRHGIAPSMKGADKLHDLIDQFGGKVDDLINQATESGKRIPKEEVFRHVRQLKKEVASTPYDNAPRDTARIQKVINELDEQLWNLDLDTLSAKDLQKLKTSTYKTIDWSAAPGTKKNAANRARKDVARAAKESLEEMVPELKAENSELGKLLDLKEPYLRSTNRIENRDFVPLTAPLQVGTGSVLAGDAGSLLGAGVAAMGIPRAKAWTAQRIYDMMNMGLLPGLLSGSPAVSNMIALPLLGGRLESATRNDE